MSTVTWAESAVSTSVGQFSAARPQDAADPARVADLACGTGWAAIELAKAYPHITVDGRDNDEASVAWPIGSIWRW
jgi:methylase of polypeptide subunit release factors